MLGSCFLHSKFDPWENTGIHCRWGDEGTLENESKCWRTMTRSMLYSNLNGLLMFHAWWFGTNNSHLLASLFEVSLELVAKFQLGWNICGFWPRVKASPLLGKGKLVDILAQNVQLCARFNGGANAGHTLTLGELGFVGMGGGFFWKNANPFCWFKKRVRGKFDPNFFGPIYLKHDL